MRFILATIACALAIAPAAAQSKLDALPAALKPAGLTPYLEVPATGVQIYTCGKNDAGAPAWVFKAPEATLSDTQKKQIGKHYAGPTWEVADGSKVAGTVKARADAPDGNAIPWLLLGATSTAGTGVLARVANIQRLNTAGGNAPPAQTCNETHVGTESRVPYTATYYFYSALP
jgi:hypothetical protein